jgi:hypothetical protein
MHRQVLQTYPDMGLLSYQGKKYFNSAISACSNDRKGEGVMKNAFKALSLAENAGYAEKGRYVYEQHRETD